MTISLVEFPADDANRALRFWSGVLGAALEPRKDGEGEGWQTHDGTASLGVHRRGILAHYDYPISTGPLEGTNNKIKTMQRQAYGFRDHQFFKLKIYALHQTRYALVG